MRYVILTLMLSVYINSLSAQITVSANNTALFNSGGKAFPFSGAAPANNTRYIDLKEGSPFFQDNWSKSRLVTQDGNTVQDVTVKLNLMENKVHYKDSTGKELVVGVPLKEIQLQETAGGGAHFINGNILPNSREGWYLLLVNDSLTLLKGFKKTFEQHTSYGSAPEYSIKTQENYFVYLKDQEFEVKKPSDFAKILPSKKTEIEQELKKMNGKLSKDEQLSFMAAYCNSLLKKVQ